MIEEEGPVAPDGNDAVAMPLFDLEGSLSEPEPSAALKRQWDPVADCWTWTISTTITSTGTITETVTVTVTV